jgi:hypothetical protein
MAKLSKANVSLLATIVASMGNTAAPYHMATAAEISGLAKEGLVETNPEITDGDKLAVRATEKGLQVNNENNGAGTGGDNTGGAAVTPAASSFAIDDAIPVPAASNRGGRGGNVYPFDTLNVGQSFHVPATDKKPNPAKSLASTVSSATKRYVGKGDRKFRVAPVDATDPRGAGARVWRTA